MLDHMVNVVNFWETTKLSSTAVASEYIPIGSAQGFQFHHILETSISTTIFFQIIAILVGEKWPLVVVLICIFISPVPSGLGHFFKHFCASSLENVYSSSLPMVEPNCLFVLLLFVGGLYIFWVLTLYQVLDLHIFPPVLQFISSLSWQCPLIHKVLNFDKVHVPIFFTWCLCFWCHVQGIITRSRVTKLLPRFSFKSSMVLALILGLWSILS